MANRLALELIVDNNPFMKALTDAQRTLDRFTASAESAGRSLGGGLGKALDNFTSLAKGGVAAAGVLAGGFAAAASGAVALTLAAGKQAEALDHLSQRTGIGMQVLQSWSVIMAQNNFQAESLTSGMRTLSKQIVDARDPSSKAAAAFEEMGISITELGSTESTIRAISDRFEQMPDGPDKARIAVELFGKAGLEMIPILNRGAKAFDESRKDAERFGLVLSTTQVQALTAADDAVDKLSAAFDGLKTRVALVFADRVTSGVNAMTEAIAKLTNITSNYGKALEQVKQDHPILSSLFPAGAAAMAAVKASQVPPSTPPQIPQGPDQNAHIVAAIAAGEKQEALGKKQLALDLHQLTLLKAKQNAQEALGKSANTIAMQEFNDRNKAFGQMVEEQERVRLLNEELSKPPTSGPFVAAIEAKEAAVRNLLNIMPELTREEAIALAARNDASGTRIVQDSTAAWQHRNDTLELAVSYARTLDEAQKVTFQTELGGLGAVDEARRAGMNLIQAEGDLKKQLIQEEIASEDVKAGKLLQVEIELDTKRRQVIQQYPTFFEQQMRAVVQSNSFSIAQITTTWTSGLANAAVNGGNFVEQAWKSTQVAVLQGFLNLGIQIIAREALTASVRMGIISSAAAAEMGINTAKNATIVAGDAAAAGATVSIWEAAGAAITGTFATVTGAISGFFTGTIIPMFVSLGEVIETFLSAIATSLDISIFGAEFSIPVWAAVGLIAAAIGAISAFAFADGGIATGPTMGLVGEAGSSEAVIPLNKRGAAFMRAAMGGGGQVGPVTIITELDGRPIAKSVVNQLPSVLRLRGVPA